MERRPGLRLDLFALLEIFSLMSAGGAVIL